MIDYMVQDAPEDPPIKRLLALYAALAKRSSKKVEVPISVAKLAEACGVSRSRLNTLRGSYRQGRGTPLLPSEAEKIAAHAAVLLGLAPLTVRRWLLGVASERETTAVEKGLRAMTAD